MSQELIAALEAFGMIVDRPPRWDGRPMRYKMAGKKSRSGFVIGHEHGDKHYAVYGSWADRSQDQKWTDNGVGTPQCADQWREIAAAANIIQQAEQAHAAEIAKLMWEQAGECEGHPYLDNKGVMPHGCRVLRGKLLVPFLNAAGEIVNLQQVFPDGKKLFLHGGEIIGCCFPVPGKDDKIYITEGFATGATVAELTGNKTLIAFNTANLMAVGKTARELWPGKRIIFAADNDHATDGNPGIKYASAAASAINAEMVIPECPPGTDFNDMAKETPERVKDILFGQCSLQKSISISKVMATKYKKIKWAVEGIIPEGLTVLAGRPKFGKSWLMLGLGYAVATGTIAWQYGKTVPGNVYYLALEDSERRIQDRVLSMEGYFDTYPENFHIFTEFPRIGDGFIDEIDRLIAGDKNPGLIIVDTLQKIRPLSGKGNKNLYQSEYEDYEMLQRLAIQRGVPIIAVHHTRKQRSKKEITNPMDEISGSSGIQGVADTLIVCTRDGNKGMMHVTGREVDEQSYPMEFIKFNMTWKLSEPEEKQIDIGPMILTDWFRTRDRITAKEAAEIFKISLATAKRKLKDLADSGKLVVEVSKNPREPNSYTPTEIF